MFVSFVVFLVVVADGVASGVIFSFFFLDFY